MKRSFVALATALLFAIPANATDAQAVLAAPRQRVQSADFRATGHLVRVDANGVRTSYEIAIKAHWFPGVLRVLVETASAPRTGPDALVRARMLTHILLEMRPNGQSMIRIAHPGDTAPANLPFEKWSEGPLGAGFSYEDFLEPQYFWANQTALEETRIGTRECDVLKSAPGASERTHYAEIQTWLAKGIGFPLYVEKTLKGSGVVKQFTYSGLRHEGGVWSAHQVEVKIHGQAGSTLLIIDHGSAKANLSLKDFSPEQLTRF
ncbi:MAG: outer membrane lipoprotein-sorting protein [Terracidiphilus sp.]|jgi:hypothetical protein